MVKTIPKIIVNGGLRTNLHRMIARMLWVLDVAIAVLASAEVAMLHSFILNLIVTSLVDFDAMPT